MNINKIKKNPTTEIKEKIKKSKFDVLTNENDFLVKNLKKAGQSPRFTSFTLQAISIIYILFIGIFSTSSANINSLLKKNSSPPINIKKKYPLYQTYLDKRSDQKYKR